MYTAKSNSIICFVSFADEQVKKETAPCLGGKVQRGLLIKAGQKAMTAC